MPRRVTRSCRYTLREISSRTILVRATAVELANFVVRETLDEEILDRRERTWNSRFAEAPASACWSSTCATRDDRRRTWLLPYSFGTATAAASVDARELRQRTSSIVSD